MTAASHPSTTREDDRPERRAALRRGLRLEFALHRGYLLTAAALSLLLLGGALFWHVELGFLVLIWALQLPAKLASPVKNFAWRGDRDQLWRATQRVSRADTARARTLLIAIGQVFALLAVTAIVIINQTDASLPFSNGVFDAVPSKNWLWGAVLDPLSFSAAMVWSHAMVGGQALRYGRDYVVASAICTFVAVQIVVGIAAIGVLAATDAALSAPGSFATALLPTGPSLIAAVIPLLTLLIGVLFLVRRSRRWARGV